MTDKQRTKLVKYEVGLAKCELTLPADAEGKLPPSLVVFEDVRGLSNLLDSVTEQVSAGEVVGLADSEGMKVLIYFLIDLQVGPQLLKVIRAYRRSQNNGVGQIFKDINALGKLASADPNDKNLKSYERQGRRAKKRLPK